jgi:uncharacterized protein (TIGR02145 family)
MQKYCYNDSNANCLTEGGLYQWHMAMGFPQTCDNHDTSSPCIISLPQPGICPSGWHIPSDDELTTLVTYLGGDSVAAHYLKKRANLVDVSNNPNGLGCDPDMGMGETNDADCGSSNFDGLLTGFRDPGGPFGYYASNIFLWSALPDSSDSTSAWHGRANSGGTNFDRQSNSRAIALPVRCVKD